MLVMALAMTAAGAFGSAALLAARLGVPLGLPGGSGFLRWLWPALLVGGPVLLWRSLRAFRLAAALGRIEASGIPAVGQVQKVRQVAWRRGGTSRGQVYNLTVLVRRDDGKTHTATAVDTLPYLPWKIDDELYQTWIPVLVDPEDDGTVAVQWDKAAIGRRASSA